jgi:hypothetical protein
MYQWRFGSWLSLLLLVTATSHPALAQVDISGV